MASSILYVEDLDAQSDGMFIEYQHAGRIAFQDIGAAWVALDVSTAKELAVIGPGVRWYYVAPELAFPGSDDDATDAE